MYCEFKKAECVNTKKPCWCIIKDTIAGDTQKEVSPKEFAEQVMPQLANA